MAEGCPAHCSYCYLSAWLQGPLVTRVYANLHEILERLPAYLGQGKVTSRSAGRAHEGTTFEASYYTDPLAIEPITGSLSAAVAWFGRWQADAQLRFTSKFADIETLLQIRHAGHMRMRASIDPPALASFEGGTAPVSARPLALRRMACAGCPVGLTITPIIAADRWQVAYGALTTDAAVGLADVTGLDLTVELITHHFTTGSKAVLENWHPGSGLNISSNNLLTKRTKFGSEKQVYDAATMRLLRDLFEQTIAQALPAARTLYLDLAGLRVATQLTGRPQSARLGQTAKNRPDMARAGFLILVAGTQIGWRIAVHRNQHLEHGGPIDVPAKTEAAATHRDFRERGHAGCACGSRESLHG